MSPYPTKDKIEEIFYDRNIPETFNSYLADRVEVNVAGREFNLSGRYKSKDVYHGEIFARVAAALKMETVRIEVTQVIGGGDSAWAAVHTTGTGLSKSDKQVVHEFVDLVRFNSDGKIAQMKTFLDSKEMHDLLEEHEPSQTKEKETEGS